MDTNPVYPGLLLVVSSFFNLITARFGYEAMPRYYRIIIILVGFAAMIASSFGLTPGNILDIQVGDIVFFAGAANMLSAFIMDKPILKAFRWALFFESMFAGFYGVVLVVQSFT